MNLKIDKIDTTKMRAFTQCPRMYFYEYILGWRRSGSVNHLHFGDCFHQALEHLMLNPWDKNVIHGGEVISMLMSKGYELKEATLITVEAYPRVYEAFKIFEEAYRTDEYPEQTDEIYEPKVPWRVALALIHYCGSYNDHSIYKPVLHEGSPMIEVSGRCLLTKRFSIAFRMDAVVTDGKQVFALEHKTASFPSQPNKWVLDLQPGTYSHVIYSQYGEKRYGGVIINEICFSKRTKLDQKKDMKDPFRHVKLTRHLIHKEPSRMNVWYWNMRRKVELLEDEYAILHREIKNPGKIMGSFPMREIDCHKFFGRECPYLNLCTAWENPLEHTDHVPSGFSIFHWDPLEKESRVNLELGLED